MGAVHPPHFIYYSQARPVGQVLSLPAPLLSHDGRILLGGPVAISMPLVTESPTRRDINSKNMYDLTFWQVKSWSDNWLIQKLFPYCLHGHKMAAATPDTTSFTAVSVFVFYYCCNKLPQAWGLKAMEMYSLHNWRPEFWNQYTKLKSRCQQGQTPSISSRGESVPCLFQLLVAGGFPWLVTASL